jgi:hypothetical protein
VRDVLFWVRFFVIETPSVWSTLKIVPAVAALSDVSE